jgi:nucleoside 2-deoxyribosyltransferase
MRKLKIYLAGPEVFLPDAVERGKELVALCLRNGVIGLYPLDNEIKPSPGLDLASAIRTANMQMIRDCDAIIANMIPFRGPSMDPGTAFEMGAGAILDKIVVGYTTDRRPYHERVAAWMPTHRNHKGELYDNLGMMVEEFEGGLLDNLMMAKDTVITTTAEKAIMEVLRQWNKHYA